MVLPKYFFVLPIISIFSFLISVSILTYFYFSDDLISKRVIVDHNDSGIILLDIKGRPFFSFGQAKVKNYIEISKIPKNVQDAVIVSEDKDFYHHPGFSPKSILRAIVTDLKEGYPAYGASTISQQLVKNNLLKAKKNYLRKYQEILLATLL